MIRYNLKCADGHEFDAWFASSEAFDQQLAEGRVRCAICGAGDVQKALMAPSRAAAPDLSAPASEAERALADLRAHIEANSEDVGSRFVREARAMHEGAIPERQIHGQARLDEAKALIEDGIPVAPLPFMPKGKAN